MSSLPVVYHGVREPFIDLISIPGLPDLLPQYKLKDHNRWLRDVLSHQIAGARIMSFQYDFAKFPEGVCWANVVDQAVHLLYALMHRREEQEQLNRPIVFICYSFGGLILKKALLIATHSSDFRPILDNTVGILFLGCLHNERHAGFEEAMLRCAAVELRATTRKHHVTDSLKTSANWSVVKEVMESFKELTIPFPVRSFFELRRTVYQSGRFTLTRSDEVCVVITFDVRMKVAHEDLQLCSESLASLGWDHEKVIGVDMDHAQLSTFPSRADPFFEVLMGHLADLVSSCNPAWRFPASQVDTADSDEPWSQLVDINASTASLSLLPSGPATAGTGVTPTPTKARTPCVITTPHEENPDFVGREDVLKQVSEALSPLSKETPSQRTFAICALGGMGKTQIALHYVFSHRDTFTVILWAHADSRAKLAESFSRFAVALGLMDESESDHNTARQLLQEWLGTTDEPWLLIFDNADSDDNKDLLHEFWPAQDRGSILVTSRDKTIVSQFSGTELSVLDKKNAVDLLLKLTRFNWEARSEQRVREQTAAAEQIVERIGFLPLGIKQAANLIVNDACTLTEFLEVYNNRELIEDSQSVRLIKDKLSNYPWSLRTVWNMNFERLNEDQQKFINLLAFLDPDRIQLKLLSDGANSEETPVLSFVSTRRKLYKCKSALLRSSLLSQNEELQEVWMHRLVQASCHLRMTPVERQHNFRLAIAIVKQAWPVTPRTARHDPALWHDQQAYLPHVQSLCQHYSDSCSQDAPLIPREEVNWDFPFLLHHASWFLYERGVFDSIATLLKVAEGYCKLHSGGELMLADIYQTFGAVDTETNQFEGAFRNFELQWHYLQGALESGELPRPNIREVFGLGGMANGSLGLHRYKDAEWYYRQCLKVWEDVPGDQKIYRTHLATCLWLQGRLDEAEEVVTKIIVDRNDVSNFRTGQALFSLGNIQIAQGEELLRNGDQAKGIHKLQEAYETHLQALRLYKATIGERHHKTADAYHKLGWHLHRRREYTSALALLSQALDIYTASERFFRNEIARTTYKMGCVHQDVGELARGRGEIEAAERMRRSLTPPEKWVPATDNGERLYDDLVMYWTR
ncbi:MAG: hypothetical protein M1817_005200 [Caeruleum heppii]|nr:MAG: hypothetical protein M1817_005200 [Caeruleum heppii]